MLLLLLYEKPWSVPYYSRNRGLSPIILAIIHVPYYSETVVCPLFFLSPIIRNRGLPPIIVFFLFFRREKADFGHEVGIVKLIKTGNGASSGFDFNLP